MNKKSKLIIGCILFGFGANASNKLPKYLLRTKAPITEVPFINVHFDDGFWSPRIEINRTVSIPSAFHECENNGRFDNFAIAAGIKKGEHRGDFSFDDTDPYKVI